MIRSLAGIQITLAVGVPVKNEISWPMKHSLEFKNLEPENDLRQLIDARIRHIERKIQGFPPDEVFLRVLVEWNPANKLGNVSITLDMPGKILAAKEESRQLNAAVRDAFAEIGRQLENHKATLRGEHFWKRLARREELRRKKIEGLPSEQRDFQSFFEVVRPHLNKLEEYIRHALALATARGDLIQDEMSEEDLMDATLLRAYREFKKDPARGEIGNWLIRLATEELAAEVERSIRERELTRSIEEDVPEIPPAQEVSTLGEDILYFYQPDEDLKLEDLVPDLELPTPEETARTRELQECVRKALKTIPAEWRRVLVLQLMQGLSSAETARTLKKPQAEIEDILDQARQYMRRNLIELGCAPKQAVKSDAGRANGRSM
jgi:RNA polymerase sigma factor (sigma-70 family)